MAPYNPLWTQSLFPKPTFQAPLQQRIQEGLMGFPKGQALGVASPQPTPKITGGGGTQTGGGGGQTQQQGAGQYFEPTPSEPSFDLDSIIQPALEALNQAEQGANQVYNDAITAIGASQTAQTGKVELQKREGETTLAKRQAGAERTTASAISEAKRGFSEISQGLISRYGTGVSTGLGATAIVGAQTLRNIGEARTTLQTAINDIETTRQGLSEIANQAVREIEANTTSLKQQARSELQTALRQIAGERGELLSRKQEFILNAMNNYRNTIAGINQRNSAFQQNVYLQQMRGEQALTLASQRAGQRLAQLQPFTLGAGQTRYQMTPEGGAQEVARSPYAAGAGALGGLGLWGEQGEQPVAGQSAQPQQQENQDLMNLIYGP